MHWLNGLCVHFFFYVNVKELAHQLHYYKRCVLYVTKAKLIPRANHLMCLPTWPLSCTILFYYLLILFIFLFIHLFIYFLDKVSL